MFNRSEEVSILLLAQCLINPFLGREKEDISKIKEIRCTRHFKIMPAILIHFSDGLKITIIFLKLRALILRGSFEDLCFPQFQLPPTSNISCFVFYLHRSAYFCYKIWYSLPLSCSKKEYGFISHDITLFFFSFSTDCVLVICVPALVMLKQCPSSIKKLYVNKWRQVTESCVLSEDKTWTVFAVQ